MNLVSPTASVTGIHAGGRMISDEALERLVYLVGCPRSGTTVMAKSFFLHEDVLGCPSMTRFTNHVWRNRRRVDRRLLRQIFKMPAFYRERRAINSLDRSERPLIERRIHDAFATMDLKQLYQLYPLIHSLDPECEKDPSRVTAWADKGNDVNGLFGLARAFPQARFILIIRDPRATCASMQGQIEKRRAEARLTAKRHEALVASCLHWRHMMQTFLRFAARYPERSMFIRYEDFVADAAGTINSMFRFTVGRPMPEAELNNRFSLFERKTKHDPSARGQGIDGRPLERWKRMLTPDEIALVTRITHRTARKLGYSLDRPARSMPSLAVLGSAAGWRKRLTQAGKLAYLEARESLLVPDCSRTVAPAHRPIR